MTDQQTGTLVNKPKQTSKLPQLALGEELLLKNQPEQAEKCFRKVISEQPQCWQAYEYLAELFKSLGKTKSAIDIYRLGAENNPDHPAYFLAIGKLLSEQKKWQTANQFFQKALKNDPPNPWGYLNWAKVLVELNKWQKAQTITIKAIKLQPDLWEAYHHLGKILQHRHLWEPALKAYREVVKLKPDLMHGYLRMAEIYLKLEQPKEAIKSYEHVICNASKKTPVQYQAIAAYQKYLEDNPNTTAQHFYHLGKLCRAQGCFPQAIAACQRALKLKPYWVDPHITIQYTPAGEVETQELIDFYRQLVKKRPDIPIAWGNLGDALAKQGQIDEAIASYHTSCYQGVTSRYPHLADLNWERPKQNAPDFIIIGATKCGTSSLYKYLSYHPQLLLSHKKELDFFGKNYDYGMAWYLAHFPTITDRDNLFTGEATPNYLRFPSIAERIKTHCPQTKLIVLLRDPADRAISWHHHKINTGLTTGSLEDAIAIELKQLENISEVELAQGGYRKVDNIYSSLYYYQLQPWLKHFPREQLLFLKSEDFYRNTAEVMAQVFNFIGVVPQKLAQYFTVNKGFYSKVDESIYQRLHDYFMPHNQKLEELLNLEFNW